jgi:hypothetical protein
VWLVGWLVWGWFGLGSEFRFKDFRDFILMRPIAESGKHGFILQGDFGRDKKHRAQAIEFVSGHGLVWFGFALPTGNGATLARRMRDAIKNFTFFHFPDLPA